MVAPGTARQRNTVKEMKHKRILMSVAMAALVLVAVGVSALSVTAAQGSSANVKAPTVVGAPVGSGAPGVCSVDGTGIFLFIRGSDNVLYYKYASDGVTWPSTSRSLGGVLASAPAATATSNGVIEVFVRGTDGRLYEKISTDSGANWSPNWIDLGGQLLANTGPSATSWLSGSGMTTVNNTKVFVTGTDHQCWYKSQTDGVASTVWTPLGGYLISAPAATALSDGSQIGLFVVGSDHAVWYKHYATSWGKSWTLLGGQVLAGTSPAAYNFGPTQIGFFVTGTDSKLYQNWVDNTGKTSGYANLGGVLTSSPSATTTTQTAQNGISVFARGSSFQFAALYQIYYNYQGSGQWGVWTAIGGV